MTSRARLNTTGHLAALKSGSMPGFSRQKRKRLLRPLVPYCVSGLRGAATLHGGFDGNVSTTRVRRFLGADAPRRRWRRPRRGPQNAHHSAIHPPRPRRARYQLPLSRLHVPTLRRPPCGSLHPSAQTTCAGGPGWADGGATSLDNLVLLCRRHHRAVHEGGFGVIRGLDGALTFLRPDGAAGATGRGAPSGRRKVSTRSSPRITWHPPSCTAR